MRGWQKGGGGDGNRRGRFIKIQHDHLIQIRGSARLGGRGRAVVGDLRAVVRWGRSQVAVVRWGRSQVVMRSDKALPNGTPKVVEIGYEAPPMLGC